MLAGPGGTGKDGYLTERTRQSSKMRPCKREEQGGLRSTTTQAFPQLGLFEANKCGPSPGNAALERQAMQESSDSWRAVIGPWAWREATAGGQRRWNEARHRFCDVAKEALGLSRATARMAGAIARNVRQTQQ